MNGATVTPLVPRGLTASTARQLTDAIKRDAEVLWERLLDAHRQNAHGALGYSSWHAYCKVEFEIGQSRAYQLLDAGKIAQAIKTHSTSGGTAPTNERVTRPLAQILKTKGDEAVAEAWAEVVEKHGPDPTAEEVAEVALAMGEPKPEPEPKPKPEPGRRELTREQDQFARAIRNIETQCEYVSAVLAARRNEDRLRVRRVLDIDEATRAEWNASIKAIDNAARQLRRRVTDRRTP